MYKYSYTNNIVAQRYIFGLEISKNMEYHFFQTIIFKKKEKQVQYRNFNFKEIKKELHKSYLINYNLLSIFIISGIKIIV